MTVLGWVSGPGAVGAVGAVRLQTAVCLRAPRTDLVLMAHYIQDTSKTHWALIETHPTDKQDE